MSHQRTDRKYIALLALVAGLILVLGMWARPEPRNDDKPPAPSSAELMRLQRMTRLRNIQEMSTLFSEAAANAARNLFWIPDSQSTALIWNTDGTLITAYKEKSKLPEITLVQTAEQIYTEGHQVVTSPSVPIASLRVSTDNALRSAQKAPLDVLTTGDWLVAVARKSDGSYTFAPGIYGGSAPMTCGEFSFREIDYTVTVPESMLGGGLFDLDGLLVGLIARCKDRVTIMVLSDVTKALAEAKSFPAQLRARHGFRAETSFTDENAGHSNQGIKVTEVWAGRAADLAGIRPGDRITKLDENEVQDVNDLLPLVLPVARERMELQVRRGVGVVNFVLSARGEDITASTVRPNRPDISFSSPRRGVAIHHVVPGSSAARAGLRSGDVVLWINGQKAESNSALPQLLAPHSGTAQVIAERDGRIRAYELK